MAFRSAAEGTSEVGRAETDGFRSKGRTEGPGVGGGGGGLVGWEEYGHDRWYLRYLLQVLLSRTELRGVYIVGC